MAIAGRILIMPKGNYDASVTYEMLDLVFHNGTSWLAKKTVVGIEPSEVNAEYWHKMFDLNIVSGDEGTDIIDETNDSRTILNVHNGKLTLIKQVNGVNVGSVIVAEVIEG